MRDGRISGSLQRALGALLLLLLECVGEDLEAGVELHGDHAGGAHARRLAPQPALAAHLLHAPRRVLQVTLAQQPGPTWKWKIYTVNVKFREDVDLWTDHSPTIPKVLALNSGRGFVLVWIWVCY